MRVATFTSQLSGARKESKFWARSYTRGLRWKGKSWRMGIEPENVFLSEVQGEVAGKIEDPS